VPPVRVLLSARVYGVAGWRGRARLGQQPRDSGGASASGGWNYRCDFARVHAGIRLGTAGRCLLDKATLVHRWLDGDVRVPGYAAPRPMERCVGSAHDGTRVLVVVGGSDRGGRGQRHHGIRCLRRAASLRERVLHRRRHLRQSGWGCGHTLAADTFVRANCCRDP